MDSTNQIEVHIRGFDEMPPSTQKAMVEMCKLASEALARGDFNEPPVCDYIPQSNEPCATCPRRITSLYCCGLLQEALED